MQYNTEIENLALDLGIAQIGFTETAPLHKGYAEKLPYTISLTVRLSDFVIDEIETEPTFAYFQHYRTANAFIDRVVFELGTYIQSQGYTYLPIAASQSIPDGHDGLSGIVSHKAAARQAGLGSIGKNALFISKLYGPRVRLGTILTNMPFNTVVENENPDLCGNCNLCVTNCPAMALRSKVWQPGTRREEIVDAAACSAFMKSKFQHIGRGSVCGICIRSCPKKG